MFSFSCFFVYFHFSYSFSWFSFHETEDKNSCLLYQRGDTRSIAKTRLHKFSCLWSYWFLSLKASREVSKLVMLAIHPTRHTVRIPAWNNVIRTIQIRTTCFMAVSAPPPPPPPLLKLQGLSNLFTLHLQCGYKLWRSFMKITRRDFTYLMLFLKAISSSSNLDLAFWATFLRFLKTNMFLMNAPGRGPDGLTQSATFFHDVTLTFSELKSSIECNRFAC